MGSVLKRGGCKRRGCAKVIQNALEEGRADRGSVAQIMQKVAVTMRKWHKEVAGELEGRLK